MRWECSRERARLKDMVVVVLDFWTFNGSSWLSAILR
jgi:hypothetical protein